MARNSDTQRAGSYAPSVRKVRGLIHELEKEEWGLEGARSMAYEEFRPLRIEPRLKDQIMRRVAEQKTKEGIVENLMSFADFLSALPTRHLPPKE